MTAVARFDHSKPNLLGIGAEGRSPARNSKCQLWLTNRLIQSLPAPVLQAWHAVSRPHALREALLLTNMFTLPYTADVVAQITAAPAQHPFQLDRSRFV